jgi:hypothetical protein
VRTKRAPGSCGFGERDGDFSDLVTW